MCRHYQLDKEPDILPLKTFAMEQRYASQMEDEKTHLYQSEHLYLFLRDKNLYLSL